MASVLQPWVHELTYMQQSVLISATRGPDGLFKDHIAKLICRFLRRSYLLSAFDGRALWDPYEPGGGSFTGPWPLLDVAGKVLDSAMNADEIVTEYLRHTDEIPHHFHLHIVHAAEILGYKHPEHAFVRDFWHRAYLRMVRDMHLEPESEEQMDKRLGDREQDWRAAEEVTAK